MKTYLTLSAIALAAAATLSSGAMAQTAPAPDFTVTGNFGVTSDYRFRGVSQSDRDPAFQGGFDVAHKSGLYVGTWGSNVSRWAAGPNVGTALELDLYGGYKTELAGVNLDIGYISYQYPGSKTSSNGANYLANTQEAYVGFGYGPLTFKTSYVLGKNYFASTAANKSAEGTMYFDLSIAQEIAPKLTASAHAGYTDYKESAYVDQTVRGKFSYADYNVGLAYDLGNGFTASAKYFWNDAKAKTKHWAGTAGGSTGQALYKDGVAVSLTKAF